MAGATPSIIGIMSSTIVIIAQCTTVRGTIVRGTIVRGTIGRDTIVPATTDRHIVPDTTGRRTIAAVSVGAERP